MALHSNPPHRSSTYSQATSRDAGGGVASAYTLVQAAIPTSINSASSSTQEMYGQQGIRCTHTCAYLASKLTTPLTRGMKIVADDTSESYHVVGIRLGRSYGSIPAFLYADCEQIL